MTRDELAAIALRHDTVVADAMLRALGVDRPMGRRKHGRVSSRRDRFKDSARLMRQSHGVRGL